jgi:hypothetical protein
VDGAVTGVLTAAQVMDSVFARTEVSGNLARQCHLLSQH